TRARGKLAPSLFGLATTDIPLEVWIMNWFWAGLTAGLLFVGCASAPRVEEQKITVLTYNIHHGEGMDGKLDLERIANVIRSVNPDLVALQEVDRKTQRSAGVDQAEELARLTGMRHVFGR